MQKSPPAPGFAQLGGALCLSAVGNAEDAWPVLLGPGEVSPSGGPQVSMLQTLVVGGIQDNLNIGLPPSLDQVGVALSCEKLMKQQW